MCGDEVYIRGDWLSIFHAGVDSRVSVTSTVIEVNVIFFGVGQ